MDLSQGGAARIREPCATPPRPRPPIARAPRSPGSTGSTARGSRAIPRIAADDRAAAGGDGAAVAAVAAVTARDGVPAGGKERPGRTAPPAASAVSSSGRGRRPRPPPSGSKHVGFLRSLVKEAASSASRNTTTASRRTMSMCRATSSPRSPAVPPAATDPISKDARSKVWPPLAPAPWWMLAGDTPDLRAATGRRERVEMGGAVPAMAPAAEGRGHRG